MIAAQSATVAHHKAEIERVLGLASAALGADRHAPREELLRRARRWPAKLVAVLLSSWDALGMPLDAALEQELGAIREREARYVEVRALLAAADPSLRFVRGTQLASLYPAGVLRGQGDVDVVASTPAAAWAAARLLAESGWQPDTATLIRVEGELHPLLGLNGDAPDELLDADRVEISSLVSLGDFGFRPPLATLPGTDLETLEASLVCLVAERHERPFAARDAVDAVLALERCDPAELERVIGAVDLGSCWAELRGRVAAVTGDDGVGAETRDPRPPLAAWRRRIRVAPRRLRPSRVWARSLQRSLIDQRPTLASRAYPHFPALPNASTVLESGLPLFGLRLDDSRSDALELGFFGRVAEARTPIGTFVFAPVTEIRQSWLPSHIAGVPAASDDDRREV